MTKKILMTATISAALLLTTASCTYAEEDDLQPTPQNDTTRTVNNQDDQDDDYEKYGKKLGVKFKGTEDIKLIKEVTSWIGTPYKYADQTKGKGTDCSGFVSTVFKNVYGEKLYRTSGSMVLNVNKVERDALECGDILFFANAKGNIYHVAIYLGDNIFIHSATSNNVGVKTETLTLNYYKEHYYMAGRVKSLDKRNASATPQPAPRRSLPRTRCPWSVSWTMASWAVPDWSTPTRRLATSCSKAVTTTGWATSTATRRRTISGVRT